jgi:putative transposase
MRNIYRSLLMVIAGFTQKELARQVKYLKIENQILRSKLPARVTITEQERNRLCRFAKNLGAALDELATIVHPQTIRRWIRERRRGRKRAPQRGRRRTAEDLRKLVVKLAKENGWGYTRILGELRKLGVRSISRNTVKNILKENGYDPGPKRGLGTWDEFLKIHASTLWQCDFFSRKVLTSKGLRDLFVLVFLHVESRRVFVTPATYHPNESWMVEQAEAFLQHAKRSGLDIDIVMHDRDGKFSAAFDRHLKDAGLRVTKSAYRSPNTVAYVERFIQSLQQECLDYFFVFGESHMNYLCGQYVEHYHEERPHQGRENDLLVPAKTKKKAKAEPETIPLSSVRCKTRLGGLLNHYYLKAA